MGRCFLDREYKKTINTELGNLVLDFNSLYDIVVSTIYEPGCFETKEEYLSFEGKEIRVRKITVVSRDNRLQVGNRHMCCRDIKEKVKKKFGSRYEFVSVDKEIAWKIMDIIEESIIKYLADNPTVVKVIKLLYWKRAFKDKAEEIRTLELKKKDIEEEIDYEKKELLKYSKIMNEVNEYYLNRK